MDKKIVRFLQLTTLLIIFLSIIYLIEGSFVSSDVWQNRYNGCLEFLEEGRLYKNIPACGQGPVVYVSGAIVKSILPADNFEHNMDTAFTLIIIILNLILFTFIQKQIQIQRKTKKDYFLLILMLYIPLIFYFSLMRIEMFLAAFFVYLGYYFSRKTILSSIFFSLALTTKVTALFPVAILVGYYIIKRTITIKKSKLKFNFDNFIKQCSPYLITPLIFLAVFSIITPNFVFYMVVNTFIKRSITDQNLINIGISALTKNYIFISAVLIFLISSVLFSTKRKLESFLPLIGIPLVIFLVATSYRNPIEAFTRFDIHLVYIPFFITALGISTKKNKLKIILIGLLTVLIYMSLLGLKSQILIRNIDHTNNQVLSNIPSDVNTILIQKMDNNDILGTFQRYNPDLKADFDSFPRPKEPLYIYDSAVEWWFDIHNLTNASEYYNTTTDKVYEDYLIKVNQSRYDLIVAGAPSWWPLEPYLRINGVPNGYCDVHIPNFWFADPNGRDWWQLIFRNQAHCDQMNKAAEQFYTKNFNKICRASPHYANTVVPKLLEENKIQLNQTCDNKIDYLYIKRLESVEFDLFVFILVFTLIILTIKKKHN